MNHNSSATKNCSYSVTVRNYMGEGFPEGPIEEVIFENAEAACSVSISGIKISRKLPTKPKKPIIVRHFP